MKRNIVINETRSALVVSDYLLNAIKQVALDSAIDEEIYAFDTALHITVGGFKIIENEIPLQDFRSFAKYNDGDPGKVYKYLIKLLIKE